MTNRVLVLDASAVLTWILKEPGWLYVDACLDGDNCMLGTANLAEVGARLSDLGFADPSQTGALIKASSITIVALDEAQAMASIQLRHKTRSKGLSLGDRACLALAQTVGGAALTADQAWNTLELPIDIINIRAVS